MFENLYARHSGQKVSVALIGAGYYGTSVITQSRRIPWLQVVAIADRNLDSALCAYAAAGIEKENIALCSSRAEALRAMEMGKFVAVQDAMLLMDLPLDVIAESTGAAEEGARHATEAIRHGKHVLMISKEPDSVVGPILQHMARQAGLIYTPADGDQHGLLMGLASWIRSLGLDIVAAGKARDAEFVHEERNVSICWNPNKPSSLPPVTLSESDARYLRFLPAGAAAEFTEARKRLLAPLGLAATFDFCETVIAANATGLAPDLPELHQPVARIKEIPEILSVRAEGGILQSPGVIDLVTCLRQPDEAGLGGGVFATVACDNAYSRKVLMEKGLISNRAGSTALIYRPYHLCGVETSTSILCAGLLGVSTGSENYRPDFDMVLTCKRDLKAGEILSGHDESSFRASIVPGVRWTGSGLLPAYLGAGRRLVKDVLAGTTLTQDMIELPGDSLLLQLRRKQEEYFCGATS